MLSDFNDTRQKRQWKHGAALLVVCIFLLSTAALSHPWKKIQTRRDDTYPITTISSTTSLKKDLPNGLAGPNLEKAKEHWSERMDVVGVERAYKEFVTALPETNTLIAHQFMHIIGGLLYQKKGLPGIAVCDDSEVYGCYHGFIEQAVIKEGIGALKNLKKICPHRGAWERDVCDLHGVGHGVLALVGRQNIDKAISLCAEIHARYGLPKEKVRGCFSGLFMEYHFLESVGSGTAHLKPFVSASEAWLQKPCDSVPEDFRPHCYYEQPYWWKKGLTMGYPDIGVLCNYQKADKEKNACFFGLGFVLWLENDRSAAHTKDICDTMVGMEVRERCLSGAAWFYFNVPHLETWGIALCDMLSGTRKQQCLHPPLR